MPTIDLRTNPSTDLLTFDIVAECNPDHVSHVAIGTAPRANTRHADRVRAVHMQPPLAENGDMAAHVIGRLPLQGREHRNIREWIDDQLVALVSIAPIRQYHLRSPAAPDVVTSAASRRRFSCSTFVQACFDEAIGVRLVDEARVPASSRETLTRVWGPDRVRVGRFVGLDGEGPWPVLLPAHLLHALDRDDPRAAPYVPSEDDWDFPRPAPP